jgi:hypothetical protein
MRAVDRQGSPSFGGGGANGIAAKRGDSIYEPYTAATRRSGRDCRYYFALVALYHCSRCAARVDALVVLESAEQTVINGTGEHRLRSDD